MEEITASSLLFSPSNPDLLLPADHPGSPVRRSAPDRPWLVLIPPHLKIPSLLLSAHTVFSSPPPSTPCLGSPVTATSTRRMITSALTGSCSMNSATSVRLHPIPATPATPPTPMLTIDRPDAGHNRVSDPDRRLDWGRTPCAGTPWPRRGPAGVSPGTAGPSRPDGCTSHGERPRKRQNWWDFSLCFAESRTGCMASHTACPWGTRIPPPTPTPPPRKSGPSTTPSLGKSTSVAPASPRILGNGSASLPLFLCMIGPLVPNCSGNGVERQC